MSGEIEAAGAAITAGLAARAIEGDAGRAGAAHGQCLNCGATLVGAYCHSCGQSGHVERKLTHVFEEFLHGIAHFDTKAWRTFPKLILRPGTLTYEYIHGKRARYVSPLAAFLFVVFLMFFVFALLQQPIVTGNVATLADLRAVAATTEADTKAAEAELQTALAAAARAANSGDAAAKAAADEDVEDARGALDDARDAQTAAAGRLAKREAARAQLETARAKLVENRAKEVAAGNTAEVTAIDTSLRLIDAALAAPSGIGAGGLTTTVDGDSVRVTVRAGDNGGMETIFTEIRDAKAAGKVEVNTGFPELDKKILHKLDNPELAWYKIQNTVYKFSFLLVPLSLPFVAFLFLFKKDVTLYDHVVFILYSLTFMSLLFLALVVVGRAAPSASPFWAILAIFAPPTHMFFQLGGAYRLGWFSALWRTFLLTIFAMVCLSFFVALIVILGLTG